jgi:hypothetical protein
MSLTELIKIFKEASELAQPDVNGINYQLIVQRHHILELTNKAEKMRECLSLMSEGEGPNADIYMTMANNVLAEVEK